ncbi:SIP domain-containing protein [Microbacterium sp. YY-01]|uniref:SIP domain-containing protein n=1 Tax=Microbacterium sp. YY-01 TaxID=3421634 RepID=UPI003D177A86
MNSIAAPLTPRARRRSRNATVQHLIAADEHSFAPLQALLATLPLCSTGRIFIEVPDQSAIVPIDAPARMTVTWLTRDSRSGQPGSGKRCRRGMALTRAVTAWANEMFVAEHDAAESSTHITLMGGYVSTADITEHLVDNMGVDAAVIDTPAEFGILPRH